MKLLLDTHVLLWSVGDPSRIASKARAQIEDATNVRLISAASAWEIATKHALGKLPLSQSPDVFVREAATDLCADELPITIRHALFTCFAVLAQRTHLIRSYEVTLLWATARCRPPYPILPSTSAGTASARSPRVNAARTRARTTSASSTRRTYTRASAAPRSTRSPRATASSIPTAGSTF